MEKSMATIRVYIDNGDVFEYETSPEKAREHSAAIISSGYRHNDGKGEYEHYPPHRIMKVKVGGTVIPTSYPDRRSGT